MKIRRPILLRTTLLLLIVILGVSACTAAPATPAAVQIDVRDLPVQLDIATAKSLHGQDNVIFLDVREQSEYDEGHIPDVKLIPMNSVMDRLSEIPKDKTVIVTCRSGNRSGQVTDYLRKQGFANVHNMQGGLVAWQGAGYPVEK